MAGAGVTKEVLSRALGEAVVRLWSRFPQDLQERLFEEAVTSRGESIRHELAVLLHDRHPRTSDGPESTRNPRAG
jgi:hypothetical protein